MAERTRGPERVYQEQEVAKILERASGLQREQRATGSTLNIAEIEAIARDAGIDPAQVRAAARELDEGKPASSFAAKMFGAPTRLSIERRVPIELKPEHHEALMAEIKRHLGGSAVLSQASAVGRTFTYNAFGRSGTLEVTVSPAGAETVVRIDAGYGQLAGGLFGGIVGGVGGSVGPNLAWMLPVTLHWPVLSGIGLGLGFIGLTWMGCRQIFKSLAGGQQKKARALAEAIETVLKAQ